MSHRLGALPRRRLTLSDHRRRRTPSRPPRRPLMKPIPPAEETAQVMTSRVYLPSSLPPFPPAHGRQLSRGSTSTTSHPSPSIVRLARHTSCQVTCGQTWPCEAPPCRCLVLHWALTPDQGFLHASCRGRRALQCSAPPAGRIIGEVAAWMEDLNQPPRALSLGPSALPPAGGGPRASSGSPRPSTQPGSGRGLQGR